MSRILSGGSRCVNSAASPRPPFGIPPRQQAYRVRLQPSRHRGDPIVFEVVREADGLVLGTFEGHESDGAYHLADLLSLARWDSYVSSDDLASTIPARDDDVVGEGDREWLASLSADWHVPGEMECGFTDFDDGTDYDPADLECLRAVDAYLRPRSRTMRADVGDELARWGGHCG